MSQTQSPSTGCRYGRARVLAVWGQSRSTFYVRQQRARQPVAPQRRGSKTNHTNANLLEQIRAILAASPFHGEGHRKIWARLRVQAVRTSKPRVLRLLRESELLAPVAEKSQARSIVTSEPNQMWGTDATATVTLADGQVTVFAAVDHCTEAAEFMAMLPDKAAFPAPRGRSWQSCGSPECSLCAGAGIRAGLRAQLRVRSCCGT